MSYVGVSKGTAYSLSTSSKYLLLVVCVGLKNVRKVSSSRHVIDHRPSCGVFIFNKNTGASVGMPCPAQRMVEGMWAGMETSWKSFLEAL